MSRPLRFFSLAFNKVRFLFSQPAFQILSDLHLEVGQQYQSFCIPATAPYLILAGDIGRLVDYDSYLAFLARQTLRYDRVYLVLGNHEFYGLSFAAGLAEGRRLEKEGILGGKLKLLHQDRVDVPNSNTTILGCTLWSEIPQEAREVVRTRVKDFEKIAQWTVDDHNAAHVSDLSWLKDQVVGLNLQNEPILKGESKRNILVVTHHAPSIQETSSPSNVNNPWSSAFATDLFRNDEWKGVRVWVFGHTHFTTEFEKNGIKVVSNQRGYVLPRGGNLAGGGRKDERAFKVEKTIRL